MSSLVGRWLQRRPRLSDHIPLESERWNHSIHYHPLIVRAIGKYVDSVLDVGCGTGQLCRYIATGTGVVVGLDSNESAISIARALTIDRNVEYVLSDIRAAPFERESFGAVTSVATIHHLGTADALDHLVPLIRPGGVLAVVGLASSSGLRDLVYDCSGHLLSRLFRLRRTLWWDRDVPVIWPPSETYDEVHKIAQARLPGCAFRRHMLFRYSIVWRKLAEN